MSAAERRRIAARDAAEADAVARIILFLRRQGLARAVLELVQFDDEFFGRAPSRSLEEAVAAFRVRAAAEAKRFMALRYMADSWLATRARAVIWDDLRIETSAAEALCAAVSALEATGKAFKADPAEAARARRARDKRRRGNASLEVVDMAEARCDAMTAFCAAGTMELSAPPAALGNAPGGKESFSAGGNARGCVQRGEKEGEVKNADFTQRRTAEFLAEKDASER